MVRENSGVIRPLTHIALTVKCVYELRDSIMLDAIDS